MYSIFMTLLTGRLSILFVFISGSFCEDNDILLFIFYQIVTL